MRQTLVDSGATIVGTIGETFVEHGLAVPCAGRRGGRGQPHEAMASLARRGEGDHAALAQPIAQYSSGGGPRG